MHKWAVRELPDGCVQLLVWEVILRQRLASIVECGVYLSEEGTRFDTDLLHCREPAHECQLLPPGIRDGEWYPWIAFVNVVLDQDKSARRAQNPPHIAHDGLLIFMEMKGIGHDDAVEGRELERASEVASQSPDVVVGETGLGLLLELSKGAGVEVDRVDSCPLPEEVCERQGESARPAAQIGPDATLLRDSLSEEGCVISVVHIVVLGCRQVTWPVSGKDQTPSGFARPLAGSLPLEGAPLSEPSTRSGGARLCAGTPLQDSRATIHDASGHLVLHNGGRAGRPGWRRHPILGDPGGGRWAAATGWAARSPQE